MERHYSGQNSCLYNRIDVSIHDIDVSITDVHVPIIVVDISILDSYVSISSVSISLAYGRWKSCPGQPAQALYARTEHAQFNCAYNA